MDKLIEGKKVFDIEIEALKKTRDSLDNTFVQILDLVTNCKGKVIITGMGKPGHIARKIAATFASLGTPSFCIHPAEAMHGDLGMISENDVIIAISFSGESDEIIHILPNIKMIGATLVAITGNSDSTLAKTANYVQVLPKFNEACYLGFAPTSSTTTALCYGDALAVVASGIYGFKDTNFGMYHPAGSLGKRLILKVDDLMVTGDDVPKVYKEALLMDAINEMSKSGLGAVSIVDNDNVLVGIITDGDIRRGLEKKIDIYSAQIDALMVSNPKIMVSGHLAIDALKYLHENKITVLPIVNGNRQVIGTITWQMIIKAGIII